MIRPESEMSRDNELKDHILDQIRETHDRYCEVMEDRLADEPLEDVELYFGVVAKLVNKLDDRDKTLREIAQEMLAESAGLIVNQLGGR